MIRNSSLVDVTKPPKGLSDYLNLYDQAFSKYIQVYDTSKRKYGPYDYEKDVIKMSKGKFNLAKVPKKLIDDVVESSKRTGVDPLDMLGLIAQESTFGGGMDKRSQARGKMGPHGLVSGWDLAGKYEPLNVYKFFGDKGAAGINPKKTPHGYIYELIDEKKLDEWIKKNPKVAAQYEQQLSKYAPPADINWFDEMAKTVKEKGLKSYNAGDPNYVKDVMTSRSLVEQDPAIIEYLKSRK